MVCSTVGLERKIQYHLIACLNQEDEALNALGVYKTSQRGGEREATCRFIMDEKVINMTVATRISSKL